MIPSFSLYIAEMELTTATFARFKCEFTGIRKSIENFSGKGVSQFQSKQRVLFPLQTNLCLLLTSYVDFLYMYLCYAFE